MILEKLPSLTGGWLVDELLEELDEEELLELLLDDGLLLELLLEEDLLLLELELLLLLELEELLLLELELDLLELLDTGSLDSESLVADIELSSITLVDSLLAWLLFATTVHEEIISVDKKAKLRNIFLFFIDVTPLDIYIFIYEKLIINK